jgi:DNA-binding NarL/FixJ family response regulator
MEDQDSYLIVCIRVGDATAIVKGATIATCDHCHAGIWVSPSSREIMQAPKGERICTRCAARLPPPDQVMPLTPRQRQELRDPPEPAR